MKKFMALLLIVTMSITMFVGCSGGDNSQTEQVAKGEGEVITFTYPTYRVGAHMSAESEKIIVDAFNEKYQGKYYVEIEEIPSQQAYTDKMKILASTNSLPAVIEGFEGIYDLAIANGQAVPLNKFIEDDAQYQEEVGQIALEANVIDGNIMSIPHQAVAAVYFYNKEHFEKAGIRPAQTMDEFNSNLEALANEGYTPLSLMTGENGWSTNLVLASLTGAYGGADFMNTKDPESFNVPALEQALTDVTKYLQQYTTKDALGAGYAVIENHFMNETTSILINGVWACSNLYENLGDKVGVAKFPEDTAIINYERGYVVCQQKNDSEGKIAQAAAEFIKFKTSAFGQQTVLDYDGAAPLTDAIKVTEGSKSDNPLFNKAIEAALSADNKVGQLNYKWQAEVADELVKQYANLVDESKTPEEVCNILTEIVQK